MEYSSKFFFFFFFFFFKSRPCAPIYYVVGPRTQTAGYTPGYNRAALMVPSNYDSVRSPYHTAEGHCERKHPQQGH